MTAVKPRQEEVKINGHSLTLTNLDKVFWKKEGITKGDLIQYYHQLAPTLLPYLKDRPMVLHRYPNGIEGESFYQKNVGKEFHRPKWLRTTVIEHEKQAVTYLMIDDEAALLYAVNLGCIEMHPFSSREDQLEYPDYLVFDLDPEDIHFDRVVEAARAIYDILESIHIKSYCKTSGGRGLHIYVPLAAKYTYEQSKHFGQIVAIMVNQQLPKTTSLERHPHKRQKRVYIDVLQNNFGQTLVAPYCLRPKPLAPVSMPLKWSEVKPGLDRTAFNIHTCLDRVKKLGDIFKPILKAGANLDKSLKLLEKI